jgi:HEAT repeat protein
MDRGFGGSLAVTAMASYWKRKPTRLTSAYDYMSLEPITPGAIDCLLNYLADKDSCVRKYVAVAFGEIPEAGNAAVRPLVELLKDPDREVRAYACVALGKIGAPALSALLEALGRKESFEEDMPRFQPPSTTTPRNRPGRARTTEIPPPPMPAMAPVLRGPGRVADYAALAILAMHPSNIDLELVEQALYSRDWEVRGYACFILGRMGPAAVPRLEKALDDPDSFFRSAVFKTLIQTAPEPVRIRAATRLLADPEKSLRSEALQHLVRPTMGDSSVREGVSRLLDDPDPSVSLNAAHILIRAGENADRLVRTLRKLFTSSAPHIAHEAASGFEALIAERSQGLTELIELARDARPQVSVLAIQTLGSLVTLDAMGKQASQPKADLSEQKCVSALAIRLLGLKAPPPSSSPSVPPPPTPGAYRFGVPLRKGLPGL